MARAVYRVMEKNMAYHSFGVFKDTPKAGEDISFLFFALSAWVFQPLQSIELLELIRQLVF